ncbi:DUF397 domain-containing protein [Actinomadura sp. NEAU-AAG7]|uniref:DUF397 domain-containing protein n=1 Tax=Actinomadura sp. NEAU-AAG7 TaxID=2839640 RepID=UPI001BE3F7F7|nr:DUF397 domain-containing protein [Actinomadura sp. NEAU-AAG7]MBT2206915.1 DUF397 domain-containing protein [Actinomadura sp. NEAU-AAG7]
MSAPDWSTAAWRKSARSNGIGNCVEVATSGGMIGVRDSKDISGGVVLVFAKDDWSAFTGTVKAARARH